MTTTTTPATTTIAAPPPPAYLFDEEFNGTSLDTSKWTPNWFGTVGPVNSAEAAGYSSSHLSVGGGYLSMTLTADPIYSPKLGKTVPYTGALLTTQPSGQFKVTPPYRIEARMFLPASGGQVANWPAFWSNGNSWPTDGENDVMEGLGGDACWHYHSPPAAPATAPTATSPAGTPSAPKSKTASRPTTTTAPASAPSPKASPPHPTT